MLGIGRHPSELVSDPSLIQYSALVANRFWEVEVSAITVYINGTAMPVQLGRSRSGNIYPTATLDSGVPFILATSAIANGIYGALGIQPATDGQCRNIDHHVNDFELTRLQTTYPAQHR
jgi:hypothetical protein